MPFLAPVVGALGGVGPAVQLGAGILGSVLGGRTSNSAINSASRATNTLADIAKQQSQISLPALQSATNYYQTLLGMPTGTGTNTVFPTATTSQPSDFVSGVLQGGQNLLGQVTGSGSASYASSSFTNSVENALQQNQQMLQNGTISQAQAAANYQALTNAMRDFSTNISVANPDVAGKMVGERLNPGGQYYGAWQNYAVQPPEGEPATGTATGGPPQTQRQAQRIGAEQALAVPIQQLNEQYDAIRRNIEDSLPPGGVRDQALAQVNQARARDIGQLFSSLPGQAAAALAGIGLGVAPVVNQGFGNAIQGFTGIANQAQQGFNTGVGIGGALGNIIWNREPRQTSQGASNGIDLNSLWAMSQPMLGVQPISGGLGSAGY